MVDVSKAMDQVSVDGSLFEWLAVHGNLCLALRHPENSGPSRMAVVAIIERIGKLLVKHGILTQEELDYATRVEHEEFGLERIV